MAKVIGFVDPKDYEIAELKKEVMALYELNQKLTEKLMEALKVIEANGTNQ